MLYADPERSASSSANDLAGAGPIDWREATVPVAAGRLPQSGERSLIPVPRSAALPTGSDVQETMLSHQALGVSAAGALSQQINIMSRVTYHLDEEPRGFARVYRRSRIRDVAQRMFDTLLLIPTLGFARARRGRHRRPPATTLRSIGARPIASRPACPHRTSCFLYCAPEAVRRFGSRSPRCAADASARLNDCGNNGLTSRLPGLRGIT